MQVVSQDLQDDGSAWAAVVVVAGVMFRASYVANRLTCGIAPYKNNPRRPRWAIGAVQRWAEQQVAAIPADWMAMHREMYAS